MGRAAVYALDARREVVRRVVLPAFEAEARLGERLRRGLQRRALALRPAPALVVLYGSVARGAVAPGDVDLLVVLAEATDEESVRAALLEATRAVERRFQLAVHPVVLTAAELRAHGRPPDHRDRRRGAAPRRASGGTAAPGSPAPGPAPTRVRTPARDRAGRRARAHRRGCHRRHWCGGARMTRQLRTRRVDRAQASTYRHRARGFRADAETMASFAGELSGNGLAVLCVHAAIAYADALAVRAGAVKSASGEHLDAVDLLESVVRIATDADRAAVTALRHVLQREDEVSSLATLVRPDDAARVLERLQQFGDWAERRYERLG